MRRIEELRHSEVTARDRGTFTEVALRKERGRDLASVLSTTQQRLASLNATLVLADIGLDTKQLPFKDFNGIYAASDLITAANPKPARFTAVDTFRFRYPRPLVSIGGIAVIPKEGQQLSIEPITTPGAPKAVAAYSQGIIIDGYAYTSGQVAFDQNASTPTIIKGGMYEQTRRTLSYVEAVLKAGGVQSGGVEEVYVLLKDKRDRKQFLEVYERWSMITGQERAPKLHLEYGDIVLPDAKVEVRCVGKRQKGNTVTVFEK